ncbi:hypothetical protein P175DRAFT_0518331 [Aspergillus ochraceoroseus IBT 24754]|uniref:Uncharacterized protein n=1 Tax=Aspergillus ochraceoroseus IBT 24754 TaxID=1392256 RepID=A0A2T5LRL9_9EURO|nr:uncharacterized protein P175DRAFT_0518331 [Aspergillus ochraceoroseus IBT 24754]PTU18926.1 hypothetical protein P175DRAFT_0518331 [Aspergillus ochraceoroseus IBT 24754]
MRPSSPLTTTLIQSTILNAISNVLAQIIDQHKKHKTFSLNTTALIQFVTYAIIILPLNYAWQRWLEIRYPGFPSFRRITATNSSSTAATTSTPTITAKSKKSPSSGRKRSGMYNFAMKFLLDQTVGSVANIVLFIVLINGLKGSGGGRIYGLVCEDFTPIMIARLKYRPLVSTLMYTVVAPDRRVVFGSACGVIWSVYLSLYAAV